MTDNLTMQKQPVSTNVHEDQYCWTIKSWPLLWEAQNTNVPYLKRVDRAIDSAQSGSGRFRLCRYILRQHYRLSDAIPVPLNTSS